LFLVLNFITVAVFYLLLGAPFIAMAQITVYAGAIMVLFLFVIMLLGAEHLARGKPASLAKTAGGLLSIHPCGAGDLSPAFPRQFRCGHHRARCLPEHMESLREMAMTLFSQYLLPFEVTSILLLVAMIGAIVLSRQEKGGQK
jgi:NADH-quinone oxidoreductase subunit J